METAIFILAIVAFLVCAAFAHAKEKAYNELRESIDKLYNYISKEKRERDFLYGELKDKENECYELRERLSKLTPHLPPNSPRKINFVYGVPNEYNDSMWIKLTTGEEERDAIIIYPHGREENYEFVPDTNGSMVMYYLDGEAIFEQKENLDKKVIAYEPLTQEPPVS